MIETLEIVQHFVSFALFGLIWTIQLVHYPAFRYVDPQQFSAFEKMHTFKITLVVAPLMLIELLSLCALLVLSDDANYYAFLLSLVVLIWLTTFLVSVPYHQALRHGKDSGVIEKLIRSNWIRTSLWSVKALVLMIWM